MTLQEAVQLLDREGAMDDSDFNNMMRGSHDGFTDAERETDEVVTAEYARDSELLNRVRNAAGFTTSKEVELYFFFDMQEPQIPFGD